MTHGLAALRDIDIFHGSLMAGGRSFAADCFTATSGQTVAFTAAGNSRDRDEAATIAGREVLASASRTVTSAITLGPLAARLDDTVAVNVFETDGVSYVHYPDGDRARLFDGLVGRLLAAPRIDRVMARRGIPDLAGHVAQAARLTFRLASTAATPTGFIAGTEILTARGAVAIGQLVPGDQVLTRDSGFRKIRRIDRRTVPGTGRFAPVHIPAGVIGNDAALTLLPEHRVLRTGWIAELIMARPEVLVTARHLVDGERVRRVETACSICHHLVLDRPELISANGACCESGDSGTAAMDVIDAPRHQAVRPARPTMRPDEAALLRHLEADERFAQPGPWPALRLV